MSTEQEHAPTPEEIAAADPLNLNAMLVRGLMAMFWEPKPIGYALEMQSVIGPNGFAEQAQVPVPRWGRSPMQELADALWSKYGTQLIDLVLEQVDVADLAEKMAASIFTELTKEPSNQYGTANRLTPSAQNVREQVLKRVSEKLSDDVKANWEMQQSAMLQAWQEKQDRERERGQLYSGTESAG